MKCVIPVILLTAGAIQVTAQVADSTEVIEARGLKMTKAEFEGLVEGQAAYRQELSRPEGRRALGEKFGKAFALEAEARRRKLDEEPEFKLKMRSYAMQALAAKLLEEIREEYLKDDAKLKAIYEQRKQEFSQPKVRQILVRSKGSPLALRPGVKELTVEEAQAKARTIRGKLAAGADFATLAKAESDDPGSAMKGGDMGFVRRGSADAGFEAVAYSLPVGELSGLIRTEFGFYIIKVEERKAEPFEAVRKTLANDLAHKEMDAIALKGYQLNATYFGN
ncbi:MAG: peptidylprolyl isomerase [Acidobacteria bacterium]|nr:peptidylprolyl isomerase [Acidobacteriota bacterium]